MIATLKILLALATVALAQTAVLAYMVIDRVQLLRTGREIVLPIAPVDPRDLFRGEYVRLGYDISRVPLSSLEGPPLKPNETIYVTLEKKEDGGWRVVGVTRGLPDSVNPDRVVLKGRADPRGWGWMRYGIESYFVPQGQGPKLEAMMRDRKLAVLVAVDKTGKAAIKGLIIDGKLQYEEPLL
jgi:uncharacterized membrane-anchored protein